MKKSLQYHKEPIGGKIGTSILKPLRGREDLELAYTPGVADVCLEIAKDPLKSFDYTNRGHLVAVVTNGTAVLGLGDIGPYAAKPVMEGKAALMKAYGNIDAIDINIDEKDPEKIVEIVKALSPSFGAINLEDIKAPECFYIESRLQELLDIPVFHDDQHGTAVCVVSALKKAATKQGLSLKDAKVVFSGAGASALATANLMVACGVDSENMLIVDRAGVIYKGRQENMNDFKKTFARETSARTLKDALEGANVFVGLSSADLMTEEMLQSMAPNPVVFAMANPVPEISIEKAKAARSDVLVATGRSDDPNQVNNLLCFPFLLRGALDSRASTINMEMRMAAAEGLSVVAEKYETIVPPFTDQQLLVEIAAAVYKAAVETGVAQISNGDVDAYRKKLVGESANN